MGKCFVWLLPALLVGCVAVPPAALPEGAPVEFTAYFNPPKGYFVWPEAMLRRPEVRDSILDFQRVLKTFPPGLSFSAWTSADGRAVLLEETTPDNSRGLWVFPDWQAPNEVVHLPTWTYAIKQRGPFHWAMQTWDARDEQWIVDVRSPLQEVKLPLREARVVATAFAPRWATASDEGVVRMGRIELGRWIVEHELKLEAPVKDMVWTRNSQYLVVATADRYTWFDLQGASAATLWIETDVLIAIGETGVIVPQGRSLYIASLEAGRKVAIPPMEGGTFRRWVSWATEPLKVSPSGRFILCTEARAAMLGLVKLPPRLRVRRVPGAPTDTPIPEPTGYDWLEWRPRPGDEDR